MAAQAKRETLHLILQNSISLEILSRVPLNRSDSDLHLEMNDSVSYRRDRATPVGFIRYQQVVRGMILSHNAINLNVYNYGNQGIREKD